MNRGRRTLRARNLLLTTCRQGASARVLDQVWGTTMTVPGGHHPAWLAPVGEYKYAGRALLLRGWWRRRRWRKPAPALVIGWITGIADQRVSAVAHASTALAYTGIDEIAARDAAEHAARRAAGEWPYGPDTVATDERGTLVADDPDTTTLKGIRSRRERGTTPRPEDVDFLLGVLDNLRTKHIADTLRMRQLEDELAAARAILEMPGE